MFCAMDACAPRCMDSELVMPMRDRDQYVSRPSVSAAEEILYPPAEVRWFSGLERHPSFFEGAAPNGFEPPKISSGHLQRRRQGCPHDKSCDEARKEQRCGDTVSTATGGSRSSCSSGNESWLHIKLNRAANLQSPHAVGDNTRSYFATAFYPSETQNSRFSRRTRACQARLTGTDLEECIFDTTFCLPLNHREQFVKVAIYAQGPAGDLLVGETSVPVADRRTTSMASWPLVFEFVEIGELVLQLEFAAREPDVSCKRKSPQELRQGTSSVAESLGLKVGDLVEVFSKSTGKWLQSEIAQLDDSTMTVYSGDMQRRMNPQDENLHSYVRVSSSAGKYL